jgi:thiamine-phosphate diphosphorylase
MTLPSHLIQSRLRGLYVITDGDAARRHVEMAEAACRGGAAVVQLRAKNLPLREALQVAVRIRRITCAAKVLFVVNDRLDLALAAHADGVHLGDEDIPAAMARRIMGRNAVIGVSASTVEEADEAAAQGASYLGVGAVFATSSKADAGEPIGLEQLHCVAQYSRLPVAAIGGIDAANIADVIKEGARMACVISAVSKAASEEEMTNNVRQLANHFKSSIAS